MPQHVLTIMQLKPCGCVLHSCLEENELSFIGCGIESMLSREGNGCWEDVVEEVEMCNGARGVLVSNKDVGVSGIGTQEGIRGEELEEFGNEIGKGESSRQ